MLFNSLEFLFVFLPAVFIIYFALSKFNLYKFANLWLLAASLYFYAYYKIEYLFIMAASILFNYTMGYAVQKAAQMHVKKLFAAAAVIGNLGLLFYFKYFNFLIETFNSLAASGFETEKILLPLGISFFTFQQISYIIDLYKGEAEHTGIAEYSLFVCFFPQLIAGPICVFKELAPQFRDKAKKIINRDNIYKGIFFITAGLAKKTLLADNFSSFIQAASLNTGGEFFYSWTYALAIALQGYFDFSGYCDMALGIAALFNIDIPVNFFSPYKSIDISEFWRRWHITMGRFLKYSVYIPLGGSRRGEIRTYLNLLIVFAAVGIWHGADWCCILYGILNGIGVCINKYWKKTGIVMNKYAAVFLTFAVMVFMSPLMILKQIDKYISACMSMLGINTDFNLPLIRDWNIVFPNSGLEISAVLLLAALILVFCVKNTNELAPLYVKSKNTGVSILLAVLFITAALSVTKHSEFIYFNF